MPRIRCEGTFIPFPHLFTISLEGSHRGTVLVKVFRGVLDRPTELLEHRLGALGITGITLRFGPRQGTDIGIVTSSGGCRVTLLGC